MLRHVDDGIHGDLRVGLDQAGRGNGDGETERDNRAWGSGALQLPEDLLPGSTVDSAAPASPRLFSYSRQAPPQHGRYQMNCELLRYVRKCGSNLNQNQDWGMSQRQWALHEAAPTG